MRRFFSRASLAAGLCATAASANNLTDSNYATYTVPNSVKPHAAQQLAVDSKGNLYATNLVQALGPAFSNAGVNVWNGSSWNAVQSGTNSQLDMLGNINTLTIVGDTLFAGGDFTSIDGVTASGFAKWDGKQWRGEGLDGVVLKDSKTGRPSITYLLPDTSGMTIFGTFDSVYHSGKYTLRGRNEATRTKAGVWTGGSRIVGTITTVSPVATHSEGSCGFQMFGGNFSDFETWLSQNLVTKSWCTGAVAITTDTLPNGLVPVALAVDSNFAYAAANKADSSAAYVFRRRVVGPAGSNFRWTEFYSFSKVAVGGKTWISSMVFADSGDMFIGGRFDSLSSKAAANIVVERRNRGKNSGAFSVGSGFNGPVTAMVYDSARKVLHVSGDFTTAGGKATSQLATIYLDQPAPTTGVASHHGASAAGFRVQDGVLTSSVSGLLKVRSVDGGLVKTIAVVAGRPVRLDLPSGLQILSLSGISARVFKP